MSASATPSVRGPSRAGSASHFPPPTLETVIVPRRRDDARALYAALTHLEEADPLINLRHDDVRREIYVSLYGEVQKEVLQDTLAADFGVEVDFRETTRHLHRATRRLRRSGRVHRAGA